MLSWIPLVCGETAGRRQQGQCLRGTGPSGYCLYSLPQGVHCGTRPLEGWHAVCQGNEIGQQPRSGGLDVPPLTEGGDGCAVDDGDDHLRLQRAVQLTQDTAQRDIEALPTLAIGLFDRGCLARRNELEVVAEVAAVGGQGRLQDEADSLGQVRNSLECLHPVRNLLGTRCPHPDVDQPRLMEKILQAVEVVGRRGQGASSPLGDTTVADR